MRQDVSFIFYFQFIFYFHFYLFIFQCIICLEANDKVGERKPMVCCKTPIHIHCLRQWFRTNSANGVHPACPHCKQEVNRILNPIRIPNVPTLASQHTLLWSNVMIGIIKNMYAAYKNSVERGLRHRLETFTFRNVDSIFLDPVELSNEGHFLRI